MGGRAGRIKTCLENRRGLEENMGQAFKVRQRFSWYQRKGIPIRAQVCLLGAKRFSRS